MRSRLQKLLTKYVNTIRSVFNLESFKFLKPTNILIYDESSVRRLAPIINIDTALVFDTSLKKLNFWILLSSLRYGKPNLQNYLFGYLKTVKPKFVLTLIDNSIPFYFINSKFPEITTIAIQNGRRDNFGRLPNTGFVDLLSASHNLGKPQVTHYCMFGMAEVNLFRKYISATFHSIGNIQNNAAISQKVIGNPTTAKPVVSFVSSHPNLSASRELTALSDEICMYIGNRSITYRSYYGIERLVAAAYAEICHRLGYEFQVIGKRPISTPQEAEFFRTAIDDIPFDFFPAENEQTSYLRLLASDVVIAVDSTLAYEMFARNKKCVFIAARGTAIGDENIDFCKFASPLKVPEAGPFWTNKFELSKCEELLKFAIGSSQDDWNSCSLEIRNQIMVFDPSNQKLTDLFSELGLK